METMTKDGAAFSSAHDGLHGNDANLLAHTNLLLGQSNGFCDTQKAIADARAEAVNVTRDVGEKLMDRLCGLERALSDKHCETQKLIIDRSGRLELQMSELETRRLRDDRDHIFHENLHMRHRVAG